jgi:hypothetical protein
MGLLDTAPVLPREAVQRWRLVLARGALAPDAVGRELQAAWHGALASSGLPVAGLDSPMPRARFALGAPLAAAVPGEAELLDTWLVERLPAWRVREALARCLPAGWRLVEVYDVWLGEAPLPGRVAASVYRATFPAASGIAARDVSSAAERALAAPTLPRERHKGETIVSYDLRPFLDAIDVDEPAEGGVVTRMTLRHDPERGVGRPDETLAALAEISGVPLVPATLVRERLVLADPPAPPAPSGRRRPASQTGRDRPPVR